MEDHAGRLKRGYKHTSDPVVQQQLKKLSESNSFTNIGWALLYLFSIPAAATALTIVAATAPAGGVSAAVILGFSYPVAALFIARQQRGLELMVHDASHSTWHRVRRDLHSQWADLLVAFPVLSTVATYWSSHRLHHGHYGAGLDPCRRRFRKMGLDHVDLSSRWKIARAVLRWLPSYNAEYYKEIGSASASVWCCFALWHMLVVLLPLTAILIALAGFAPLQSLGLAFAAWVIFWVIPAIAVLPVLRSIAEAEEHDYGRGDTEFTTTFTNIGWIHVLLLHPFNDAYHLVHHMFPAIPAVNHHKVHALLIKHDPAYRASLHRARVLWPK